MIEHLKLVRVAGRDKTAQQLLQTVDKAKNIVEVVAPPVDISTAYDYAQIDPALTVSEPTANVPVTMPKSRVGYGGLTPQQRYRMFKWLEDPLAPAPQPIRQLYIAQLETALFDDDEQANAALEELHHLIGSEVWQKDIEIGRAILLGLWLQQDREGLDRLLCHRPLANELVGIGLGQMAILGMQLHTKLFRALIAHWNLYDFGTARSLPPDELLEMRLMSLKSTMGDDPLSAALTQLGEDAVKCKPWRCTHRDLRIAIPHPNLEPIVKPFIEESLEGITDQLDALEQSKQSASAAAAEEEVEDTLAHPQATKKDAKSWSLVLEFGHSRSEYFDFAIFRARQRPSYSQIMDEDRTLIHRIVYTKSEMRHFWLLWEYVQNWSSTHVYVNGNELEKWKVWPYSQYLR